MADRIRKARTVLREEGIVALSRGTVRYVGNYADPHLAAYLLRLDGWLRSRSLREIERRMAVENGLEDALDTVLDVTPGHLNYRLVAVQLREELRDFCRYIDKQGPETVLEIGTHHGGTWYLWNRYLDSASELVSVDLPHLFGFVDRGRTELFREFSSSEMHFVRGDSHERETYREIVERVGEVDFLFIDGDHTYEGVKRDFEMYGGLVSEGGTVAFHDIVPHAGSEAVAERVAREHDVDGRYVTAGPPEWNVSRFWEEVSSNYESREFRSHPRQMGKGIGVIRM